jgi:hypothetical protein
MTSTAAPADWQFEIPRYRSTRAVHPAATSRFRFEMPLSQMSDSDCWQYAEHPVKSGAIVETKSWPHESFVGLNEAAQRVLEFFNSAPRSRLGLSPWRDGQIFLSTGFEGSVQPKFNLKTGNAA